MSTNQPLVQTGRVTTEGDELYYEVRGRGQPFLLIPAAGGDGDDYAAVADLLWEEYQVITYDRRANARSSMHAPQNFEISQQSRDAVAVLHAVGEPSAFVFGNSSGAVIALDLATTQPQAVRAVIVHEPPVPRVLPPPQARKWQPRFARAYLTAFRFGSYVAATQFMLGVRIPLLKIAQTQRRSNEYTRSRREQRGEQRLSVKVGVEFLVKGELLPVTNYLPDVARIKHNGVKVFLAVGAWARSRKTWHLQVAHILAEQLGCELVTFPGHHGSYMDRPQEWAATLRRVVHQAEA
jgi:pimeloyl-ACP methyl ester carboxylesterase